MSRLAAAVLFLLLALPGRANLGETVAQCVQRYGKPVGFSEAGPKNPFGTIIFVAGPYQLIVFLSHNVEVGARVTKKDKTAFTDGEMKTIMDADAATPWISGRSADPDCLQWGRADKATVLYDYKKKILIFTSAEMIEVMRNPPPMPVPGSATNAAPQVSAIPKTAGPFAPAPSTSWAPASAPATNAAPANP